MAKLNVNIGLSVNDKTGDTLRSAFDKINQNFTELYTLTGGSALNLQELAQDYAAPMFNHASHVNITATYDDANNKILLTGVVAAQVQSDWNASSGLGVVLNKPTLFSGSYTDLTNKPSIPSAYTLPTASSSVLGGIKIGTGLSIDVNGVVTASSGSVSSLVNGAKTVSLGTDSILTLPAPLAQLINAGQLATDTAKIYRATNSTDLVAIATAWDNWYSSELMFRELVYQDSVTNPNRPWANKPSWEAYPIITAYIPTGSQLPIPSNLPPTAKAAQDNYLAYKQLVSSIDIVNGNKTISFNNTGLLSLPGKLEFKDTANAKIILKTIDQFGYVVEDPAQDKTWTFNANGSLTFPNNTTQTTAWTGSVSSLVNGANSVSLDNGGLDLTFTSGEKIKTIFGGGIELYRSGDNTIGIYTGGAEIKTFATGGAKHTWTFGTNGKLTAPGNLQVDGGKIILNTGGNAYVESVDYGVNSANSAVNIFGGPYQKIKLRAGFGTEATWTFATDGTTTFPTNVSINYSGGNVQFPRIIADSGKAFSIQGQGASGSAALAWTVDPNAAGQYAQIGVTKNGGDNLAKVILTAQSDSSNAATVKLWKFDETGKLTLPAAGLIDAKTTATLTVGAALYATYLEIEQLWVDVRNADAAIIAPATRPWAGMPGHTAYPIIAAYTPSGGLSLPSGDVIVKANNAKNAYTDLAVANVKTTVAGKEWTFGAYGSLTFPDATTQTTAWTGSVSSLVNGVNTASLGSTGILTLPNASTISPVAQIGYSYGPYASDIYTNTTGGALDSGRLTVVNVGNLAHNNLFNLPTPTAGTTTGTIASNGDFTPGTLTTGTFVRFMSIIVNGAYIGSLAYRDDANPSAGLKIDSAGSYTGPVVTSGTLIQGYSGWVTRTPKTTTYVRWADGSSSQVTGSSVNQYTDGNTVAGLITTDNVSGKSFPATLYTANYVPDATAIGVNSNNWKFGADGALTFPNNTTQTTAWKGIPGPYADDEAATLAGVALGSPYHKTGTGGQVFVRLTSPT